jgi:hypothetical protein
MKLNWSHLKDESHEELMELAQSAKEGMANPWRHSQEWADWYRELHYAVQEELGDRVNERMSRMLSSYNEEW